MNAEWLLQLRCIDAGQADDYSLLACRCDVDGIAVVDFGDLAGVGGNGLCVAVTANQYRCSREKYQCSGCPRHIYYLGGEESEEKANRAGS